MLSPINSNISGKLKDKNYRDTFFEGRAQLKLAYDLRMFRKARGLNQSELAQLCGMKQSAISRIEQASYSKWNSSTLWRIGKALNVRIQIEIDDMADAIHEHELRESAERNYLFSVSTSSIGVEEDFCTGIVYSYTDLAPMIVNDQVSGPFSQFILQ